MNAGYEKIKERLREIAQEKSRRAEENYNKNPKFCKECSKPISRKAAKNHNIFCDSTCSAIYNNKRRTKKVPKKTPQQKRDEQTERWLNGEVIPSNKDGGLPEFIRMYLLYKSGNSCVKCGWKEINTFTNRVPVQINHIDGDWNNNVLSNLEVLCPNCHSLTEFHGSRNKGRGRPYRKSYYNR